MVQIKDYNLIEKYDADAGLVIIKRTDEAGRSVKLSDALEYIPYGNVTKEETGMGATHLELLSNRNSIVVEPIKITAYSKAKEHGALYIGSPIDKDTTRVSDDEILRYWQGDKLPKKFVVVADSLLRLVKVIGKDILSTAFLMIDEIDTFQTDAGFRDRMEDCLDIYKEFPRTSRAMVSATTMDFSDPDLKDESKTILKYDSHLPRTILVASAEDIDTATCVVAINLTKENDSEKILIAYNSVSGCKRIADVFVRGKILLKEDVKILCSESSKQEVQDYFTTLSGDGLLPAKVNFITSAYFSGFDLKERYHLISVSGNKNMIHALSEKELKQIAGRCRAGLLSETIIYDEAPYSFAEKVVSTREELISAATKELEAIKCVEKNYSANKLLRSNLDAIRDLIITHTTKDGHRYVRKRRYPNDELVVSYLNIDAYLEAMRVRKDLYGHYMQLPYLLEMEGHTVVREIADYEVNLFDRKADKNKSKRELVTKVISIIRENKSDLESLLRSRDLAAIQKAYIRAYLDNRTYIDNEQLLKLLEQTGVSRDSRKLNNLLFAAFYVSLAGSELYKRTVRYNIDIGELLTKDELLIRWNKILSESGLQHVLKSTTKAVHLTRLHFKAIKKRKDIAFKITSENPLNLKVIKARSSFKSVKEFKDFYQTTAI